MTQELWILVWAALWGIAQILIAAAAPAAQKGYMEWNAGPRDTPFDRGLIAERLNRAYKNYLETFPFFAVIVVALAFAGASDQISVWGAWVYLIARILYVPFYALATPLRSAMYLVSLAGIGMCVFTLLKGLT